MLHQKFITKKTYQTCGLLATLLLPAAISAAEIAVGPTLGTRGGGIDLTFPLRENLGLRATVAGFEYGRGFDEAGVHYDGDMRLATGGLILDWYPSTTSFRLSLGALYNGNQLKARGTGSGDSNIKIGNNSYDVSNESLSGNIKWKAAAPFLGLGWGRPSKSQGWHFGFEVGAIYTGKPTATLSASEGLHAQQGFDADLAAEEKELNDSLSKATFWPVIQLQVQYRF